MFSVGEHVACTCATISSAANEPTTRCHDLCVSRLTLVVKTQRHGCPLQIKKSVTDFAKTADQPAPEKVNADEGVYYLVNPEGEFERAFGHDIDSLAIALAVCTTAGHLLMCWLAGPCCALYCTLYCAWCTGKLCRTLLDHRQRSVGTAMDMH